MNFQTQHLATLAKYAGISFIAGAVNHGMFSEQRSLLTAAIGVVFYLIGAAMELKATHDGSKSWADLLGFGIVASIGLGFFTGGLQHFPDSPERSAWVVPLGFFVSVLALGLSAPRDWTRAASVYVLVLGTLTSVGSWGAWQWLKHHPEWAATGHGHSHGHGNDQSHTNSDAPIAQVVSRSIDIRMDDTMRFAPDSVQVKAGETIRFVVHNAGKVAHELVLGSDEDIRAHAEDMKKGTDHSHSHAGAAAISVAPGQTGELVVTFSKTGTLQMACLIPGHYEAGMKGQLNVTREGASSSPAKSKNSAHDHSTHKH